MQVRVLGDVEVEVAGALADLGGPKPRALLSLLVAASGRPVPVEQLIDQMWGEDPPARVEASLQTYVARLRRVLEPGRGAGAPATVLRTHLAGYSLDLAAAEVDAQRFASLLDRARSAPDASAVELITEALALWRGQPYAGADAPHLLAEATRLDELRLGALARLWELRLARGDHVDAVAELERLAGLHPLQERWWGLLALALYGSGRQGDALAVLRRAREHLAEELGVDPGPELRAIEGRILRHDPDLLEVPPLRADDWRVPDDRGVPAEAPAASTPGLPGREDALAAAEQVVDAARAGRGGVVLVSGEPGIGKTALARAIAAGARARGLRTGWGSWDADGSPPLHGWDRALAQATGRTVGPDRDAPDADAASVSLRQADEVVAALEGGSPALLVLDDVHWADVESLRLLRRVVPVLADLPAVLVLTTRVAPADVGEPLQDALAALARHDPVRLDLGGLSVEAVSAWVADHAGHDLAPAVSAELARRTDGNPFYLTELVRFLVAEGALRHPEAPAWDRVPGGVREVVRRRARLLADDAADLVRTAAVVGRSFDVETLEVLAADDQDVDEALEAAQVLGLVEEDGPGRFRFAHALVRDALRESIPAVQRARRHARVAAALEQVHAGQVASIAADLAEHYRLSGRAHARSGWVFARTAAAAARERSAHDEALRLTGIVLDLQDVEPTVGAVEREEALVARARALTRVGRPVDAWSPAQQAARSALARDDRVAARDALLTVTEGMVWGWRRHPDYDDDAIALWREVRARHDPDDPEDAVWWALLTAALAAEHLNRPGAEDESIRLSDEAIAVVHRTGARGPRELLVLRLAQVPLLRPHLLHRRVPLSDEIVELASRVGLPVDLAGALTARAQDRGELGRLDAAHSDVVRAHELAERHHLSQNRIVSGWCLSLRLALEGRLEESERAIADNEAFQSTLAMSGYGIGLCQLALLRDVQDRMPELEPTLRDVRHLHPGLRELHTLAMVRSGRLADLRVLVGEWRDQPALLKDYLWVLLTAIRADVWSALGDCEAIDQLEGELTPYADRLAFTVPVGFRGSVRHSLGLLAAARGDLAAARAHLQEARDVHERLGLQAWVERSRAQLDRL